MTIEEIQQALGKAGFPLTVDGIAGPLTKDAMQAMRVKYGLQMDLGPVTESRLQELLVVQAPAIGAKRLLDFIAKAEAGGNYNAYYGHAWSTVPLVERTLKEIAEFQQALGSPSTAVGAYQFIRATLKAVAPVVGLGPTSLFSKENQDLMAFELLKNRGWKNYLDGRITAKEFGDNIAKEWASMPMLTGPRVGFSYYAGDGLNKALVSAAEFLAVIEAAKVAGEVV